MVKFNIKHLAFLIVMCTIFSACRSNSYDADSDCISYMGRVDRSNPNYVAFSYPGVTIRTKFKGETICARIQDSADAQSGMHNTFYCIIDSGAPKKIVLNKAQFEYSLAAHLDREKTHTLELIKLTESCVGEVRFCGFRVGEKNGEGVLIAPDSLPDLKMEFIGNSITCGYGNELSSMTPKMSFSPLNENNYHAWGAMTARALNAQYVCTAYSGKGLCRNYEGDTNNTLPQLYNQTIANKADKEWNHEDYKPDIIVLNAGTNDFGAETTTNVAVDSIQFITEYTAFLYRLKSYHPEAVIICAVGPMVNDENKEHVNQLTRYSQYVLSAIQKAGGEKKNIHYFETEPQKGPYGEDYHPTIATHQKMAKELVSFIISNGLIKAKN